MEEVEQVRQALGLDENNFYLLGHSWGGILAMEYALQHQDKMKGMIISNMMSSVPAYNAYAEEVLGPQMPPEVLAEVKQIEAKGISLTRAIWSCCCRTSTQNTPCACR
ncbi:hypothetical protein GCM10028895_02240 [Pontibacter rugosus]